MARNAYYRTPHWLDPGAAMTLAFRQLDAQTSKAQRMAAALGLSKEPAV